MSDFNKQRGRREASGGEFFLKNWWNSYRTWVAGLDRGALIRYRVLQVLVVLAVLIIAIALYLKAWIRLPEVPDPPPPPVVNVDPGASSGSQSAPDVGYEGAELPDVMLSGRKEGYYTFLLAGRDVVSGATDTIILLTYDTRGQTISAISLLRDTMVNTAAKGGGQKRLNVVFARNMGSRSLPEEERIENGMTALKQEVGKLTGVYPDFYVLVEWEAIGNLVDAIGGVYFDVPPGMDYDDPYQDLHIHQEAGYRLLNGRDAMEVVRFRKNNDESVVLYDTGRTQIQRDFLTAVLKKCLTPEILLRLPALVQIFTENVDTDLTVGNILAFAQLAVGMDVEKGVNFVSMPCTVVSYNGASLVVANQNELLELLNNGINPYQDVIGADDLQLMYRKSGGGFGVTNAALLDSAVGRASSGTAAQPKPSGDAPQTEGGNSESGKDSGAENSPGESITIDPADIFPGLE